MGVYDRQRATVLRVITEKGEAVEWTNYGEPVTNPDEPWLSDSVPESKHAPSVAFFPAKLALLNYRKDTDVPIGDEIGYMGNPGFEPTAKDVLVRNNGKVYRLQRAVKYDPNGEGAILYILEFKV